MMDVDETGTSSNSAQPHTSSVSRNKESSNNENAIVLTTCTRDKVEFPQHHTSTSNNQETTDESEAEERLLVVYCRSGKLGAAYYTLQTGELFVLDEIIDRPPEHQILCSLFQQVRPSYTLVPTLKKVFKIIRVLFLFQNNSLPPPDSTMLAKMSAVTEVMKSQLLAEDI
ncbi:PREDICTED: uncharacterized protein LOC106111749 [Papilio polytes]|uniref:uncharacterized protein LOC106111749 n=1 Tax=Papilio polytes TaxID=76194 RepID=UPI000675C74C|nr:PREDICTED: uncharacterized protein LOC106111749 [Papilio polytes]